MDMTVDEARNRLREKAQNEATCFALNDMLKDAQEEVRRLREEVYTVMDQRDEHIKGSANATTQCIEYQHLMAELREENERLRKDAERYQWLRDNEDELSSRILRMVRDGDPDLDSAIDAARGAK